MFIKIFSKIPYKKFLLIKKHFSVNFVHVILCRFLHEQNELLKAKSKTMIISKN